MSHKFDTLSVFGGYLFLLQNKERGKENIYGMFFCLINRIPMSHKFGTLSLDLFREYITDQMSTPI